VTLTGKDVEAIADEIIAGRRRYSRKGRRPLLTANQCGDIAAVGHRRAQLQRQLDALPGDDDLAKRFGVSAATVRRIWKGVEYKRQNEIDENQEA
jgi:DNA invertase Pin-like site-specific DNA recombinase